MSNDYSQLKGIPKQLLPNKIHSIQVIKGGLNNRNILLNNSILIKNYLERDESNDPVYLRFLREKDAFQKLEQKNFLPKLLKTSESKDQLYLSRKWLDGDILSLSDIQENPQAVIYPLIQLHSESYFSEGDFEYFDVITRYLKEYQINKQHIPKEFPEFSILEAYFEKNCYMSKRL
jgi:serine/threonine protein kinase